MNKFEIKNREWRQERSRRLLAMLATGEILPCEAREEMGEWMMPIKIAQPPICAVEIDPPKICTECGNEFTSTDGRDKKCWRCQGYAENPELQRQEILRKPLQKLAAVVVLSKPHKKPESVKHPPCDRPQSECVNCREIFGNEKCRWGIL